MDLTTVRVTISGKHVRMDDEEVRYWLRTDGEFAIPVTHDVFKIVDVGVVVDVEHDSKFNVHSAFFWITRE